jgi:Protein of unknown function (DUF1553)/Protein of unknown function (DUF1549)/Planctomycete cytochrome C
MTRDRHRILCGIAAALALGGVVAAGEKPSGPLPTKIDFNRDVRPILADKCFRCHGPDAKDRRAELRLDVEKSAKEKREDHYAIVPGRPERSELVRRISSRDADTRMPPPDSKKSLSKREIAVLTAWIRQGAVWARHWAYVPPRKHPVPTVKNGTWPRNWIDRFILARLEREGVQPSPEADRVTLIRRLSFDLTGLPPTPDEVDRFADDRRPDAYDRLVDRLLASPAFGERMAVYWLDLVRFADTVGYHGDQDHAISPYRDFVIDAFNDNLPFNRFTRDQLAGDLQPNSTVDQKIASAYNRVLQTSHEGGVQRKEYLAIYAADRIRNLSQVWMAATMGCCQCHDHKFDPFTSKDFYAMQAFFADIDEDKHLRRGADRIPTLRLPELAVLTRRERHDVKYLEKGIARLNFQGSKEAQRRLRNLRSELAATRNSARKVMITKAIKPRTIRLLPRGNWLDDSGPVMQPAVPAFLGRLDGKRHRPNRLDLANWLCDPDHGIGRQTARVMANRFWYLCFGSGIAKVLDDFGGQGEVPSHPELLDNLAMDFLNSGWDVKHMLRLIVTSATYRQSSSIADRSAKLISHYDPQSFASQSRFRLPAEMIRDNALAVSGLLVRKTGGASVKPYQPAGYYRHLNFPKRTYKPHLDDRQWRRGVYVHWQRQFLHPMLKAFDAPSREECTAQRPRSNTPIAAITLLNDPTFVEAARVFAARILKEGGRGTNSRLDYAFRWAVSRKPDEFERKSLTGLLESQRRYFQSHPEAAAKLLKTGIAPVPANADKIELAAWTALARATLNLNETITRN